MKHKFFILVITFLFIGLFLYPNLTFANNSAFPAKKTLNIATVDNRPLCIDRLLYTALKEIDYQATLTTAASLSVGYTLANAGEKDGAVSSTPNMEQLYPKLRQVPVVIEYNNVVAFTRADSNLKLNRWSDLSNLKVGILTQRVYIQNQIPQNAKVVSKETTSLVFDGLIQGEYDVVVLSQRAHETINLPNNVVSAGQLESLPEYLYLHENNEHLIPEVTAALNKVFADGRGEKILNDIPIPEMYRKKTILHIISSNTEVAREEQFNLKLKEYFKDDTSIEWCTIALNSKRFSGDPNRLVYFANLLRHDCVSRNIAAIIVSGEDALTFLKDYYFRFFKNVPVLFYGIGDNYNTAIQQYEPYFTGVVEQLSALETVSAGLELFPNTKNLYVVNDFTTEGKNYKSTIENQLKYLTKPINIEYNQDLDRDSLLADIKKLPKDSLVFVGSYFSDANGQYFSLNEMKRALESNCDVPIISLYSTSIDYNAIGGKCLDYEKYGEIISVMLKRLLDGEIISNIPITSGYNYWVFDKKIMDKTGIKEKFLPQNALIINKKPSIWEVNPLFAFGMVTLLIVSISVGALAQFYTYKDKLAQKKREQERLRYEEDLYKALLAAEEASRMKSAFLANMSHEIRTPMNSIIGFSELALEDNVSPKTKDYLNKIKISSDGLLQIINDILDISKIEAGKVELENIPFNIHEVFKGCQTIVTPKALEKELALYCYAEPSIGKNLLGDPTRLRQVLLNLVSNAIKFTNTGIVKLFSSITDIKEDSITIYFEIKDSGIGMSPEQIKKIYEPFVQADESTTRKYGGTGLGLSITKNIIELMGGELKVESVVGIGSKFSFELTFKTIEVPADVNTNDVVINIEKPIFNGTVLLCEDNLINQQLVIEHLSKVGLKTVIANNGKEGVNIVARRMENGEKPFDLILMDIHMPVMDGLEAAGKLTQMNNKTPIVAITANVMINDRETYRSHGIPDYVAKPFTAQELWKCLLKYIQPVDLKIVPELEQTDADEKLRKQILTNFVKDNQTTFSDINAAIESGDIKLAYRLAHTLKGLAGLIGKTMLQEAASVIEHSLKNGKAEFTKEQMNALELELNASLKEFAPLLTRAKPETPPTEELDKTKALELLEKLTILLKSNDADSLDLIDDLAAIPGTETLITQLEEYEFTQAGKTLADIKLAWKE